MSNPKKKPNNLNRTAVQHLKDQIDRSWPSGSVRKAFYLADPDPLKLSGSSNFKQKFVSASIELREGDANLRIYRRADKGGHDYDVDETRGVNKSITIQLQKADIEGHHLKGTIPDDLMRQEQSCP